MNNSELIGFENLLGRKVLEDPRIIAATNKIKIAVEEYEACLVAVAIEQGLVKEDYDKKEIH